LRLAICVVASEFALGAHAQVYKCQGPDGRTVYADAPCATGGKPLRLQDPTGPSTSNPTACAQLLDETRRLATEAERDAKRGKPANSSNAKSRQSLAGEYQRRCAGLSKSTQ
jgi:hypothetical protein